MSSLAHRRHSHLAPALASSSARPWVGLLALLFLFPFVAIVVGPAGLVVGAAAVLLMAQRAVLLWKRGRRVLAVAYGVGAAVIAASMVLPVWSHAGPRMRGDAAPVTHLHYLWELGHVH